MGYDAHITRAEHWTEAADPGGRAGARYGLKWWLYPNPTDTTRVIWAGSGFGGQVPVAVPEDDLIVVVNQWNILPGQPSLRTLPTLARILNGVTEVRRVRE